MSERPHPVFSARWVGRCLLRLFDAALTAAVCGFAIFTFGLLFARLNWRIDNAASFEPLYLTAGTALVVAGAIRRARISTALIFAATAYHAVLVLPYISLLPHAKASGPRIRVMTANLQFDGPRPGLLFDVVRNEAPDVLALQEVTHARLADLSRLRPDYPYWTYCDGGGALGGVGVLSKFPLSNSDRCWIAHGIYASLMTDVSFQGENITLMVVHAVAPFSDEMVDSRNAQLAEAAKRLSDISAPCILAGDLNATMWSPCYRDLTKAAKLQSARKGFGVLPTFLFGGRPLVPIDHILFTGNLRTVSCRVGGETGSDHRPLVADLALNVP